MLPITSAEANVNSYDKAYGFLGLAYEQSIPTHIWIVGRATSNHGMGPTSTSPLVDPVVGNVLLSADVVAAASSVDVAIPDDVWMFIGSGYIDLRPNDTITENSGTRKFNVLTVSHNNPLLTICTLDEYGQAGSRT